MIASLVRLRPAHVLALVGLLMGPLATVAPLGLAPLLAISALAVLACGGSRALRRLEPVRPLVVLLALLGLTGAASAAWSIIPVHSLLEGLRFMAICAGGLALVAAAMDLDVEQRTHVQRMLLLGFVVALVILAGAGLARALFEPVPEGSPLAKWLRHFTVFDRGATTLALSAWPAAMVPLARGKRLASVGLLIATLIVLLTLRSRSAMLCLVTALAVWPAARVLPRFTAALIGAGLIGLVAAFPALPLTMDVVAKIHQSVPSFDNSAIHRLAIWHFGIERIEERPLLGWGLDASRAIPGGSDHIDDPRLPEIARANGMWMPLHPHNAALQWRLELGLPGTALATLAVLWILARASSRDVRSPALRAASLALIAASLVVAMLSYGFWQAWWQSSLWLIAALMIAAPPAPQAEA